MFLWHKSRYYYHRISYNQCTNVIIFSYSKVEKGGKYLVISVVKNLTSVSPKTIKMKYSRNA